jgi:hypothetical protein
MYVAGNPVSLPAAVAPRKATALFNTHPVPTCQIAESIVNRAQAPTGPVRPCHCNKLQPTEGPPKKPPPPKKKGKEKEKGCALLMGEHTSIFTVPVT